MATLLLYQAFQVTIGGKPYSGGSLVAPQTVTVADSKKFDNTKELAIAETWDAWGVSGEPAITAPTFIWIESDLDGVQLELTIDKGGEEGTVSAAYILKANKPFVFVGNGGLANYTPDFATGTVDVIDRIRVRNPSGASGVANVRVFLLG